VLGNGNGRDDRNRFEKGLASMKAIVEAPAAS